MLQEAVELLLLLVGQPDTGGDLISCTDAVTASALRHSSASLPFLTAEKTGRVCVCVRARVCVQIEYAAANV